jgi:hypothetical protein
LSRATWIELCRYGDRIKSVRFRRALDDLGTVRKTGSVREQDRRNAKRD